MNPLAIVIASQSARTTPLRSAARSSADHVESTRVRRSG